LVAAVLASSVVSLFFLAWLFSKEDIDADDSW
jgi:hypothetical protein